MNAVSRPTLASKTRLRYDRHRDAFVLLWPERGLLLNRSAGEILERCRGHESLSSIVTAIASRYPQTRLQIIEADVQRLIRDLSRRGLLTWD